MERNHQISAALGIRPAANGTPLFLEHYLDAPIENTLATKLQRPISRDSIVEVGNLAAEPPGSARYLFIALTAYLWGAGYEWTVFTAVPRVINSFARLGIPLQPLVEATIDRLPATRDNWGNYYDQRPQVVICHVAEAASAIRNLLELRPQGSLVQLWQAALRAGRHSDHQLFTE
jgi:hypothetical protein